MHDVERFMRHYFLIAKTVGDLTAILCAGLEDSQAKPMPVLSRMMERFRPRARRTLSETEDFIVDYNRICIADPDVFAHDPVNLIRIFYLAQKYNLAFHPDTMRAVTRSLQADRPWPAPRRGSKPAVPRNPDVTGRRRDGAPPHERSRVLGRFVRSFGRIVAMMQFNMYHHYTVDEHLLALHRHLSDIEAGRADDAPFATELMRTIQPQSRKVLYGAVSP